MTKLDELLELYREVCEIDYFSNDLSTIRKLYEDKKKEIDDLILKGITLQTKCDP